MTIICVKYLANKFYPKRRQRIISKLRSGLVKRLYTKIMLPVTMILLSHIPVFPSFPSLSRDSSSSMLTAHSLKKSIRTDDKIFVTSKRFKLTC